MSDSISPLPAHPSLSQLKKRAKELLEQLVAGDHASLQRLKLAGSTRLEEDITLADAQFVIAREHGFESWAKCKCYIEELPPPPVFYRIDRRENKLNTQGAQSDKDWEAIFDVMRECGVTKLQADGITDAAMKRLSRMDQVLQVSAHSDALTDAGLRYLANMPQLVDLEIGGSQITDRGFEALRHLTKLRRFQSCWTKGISDTGAAHLALCGYLENVNLMGTATGDGLIKALAGIQNLHHLKTGRNVTDAGIELLHQIPAFKTSRGDEISCSLVSAESQPNHLLIDGPFTDSGLKHLAHMDGIFGLSFFWHSGSFTSKGLQSLSDLASLGFLGCQGDHCDDEAMSHIAALPHLKMLMAQSAVAGDKGWRALSKSKSIQYIWGRDCPNFTSLGFAALGDMPALRGMAISCKNVDDAALSNLPNFPALREIVAMDISDAGFRHLGRCRDLEALWCMYCRDTTDAATMHIGQLPNLQNYYAGMTRITDRSLEILSSMNSLRRLEFWSCQAITNTGVAKLAALPRLRELTIDGSPAVTPNISALFSTATRVTYAP